MIRNFCLYIQTPLHLAILDGKENIVQLLLDHGVDINVKDAAGLSPLELAKHIKVQKVIFMVETEMGKKYCFDLLVVAIKIFDSEISDCWL